MVYDQFCDAYDKEDTEGLIMIVQSLRIKTGLKNTDVTPKMVIEMGIVPKILEFLQEKFSGMSRLQSESAWLIANISSGDIQDTLHLIEKGAIGTLAACLKSDNEDLQENVFL